MPNDSVGKKRGNAENGAPGPRLHVSQTGWQMIFRSARQFPSRLVDTESENVDFRGVGVPNQGAWGFIVTTQPLQPGWEEG